MQHKLCIFVVTKLCGCKIIHTFAPGYKKNISRSDQSQLNAKAPQLIQKFKLNELIHYVLTTAIPKS